MGVKFMFSKKATKIDEIFTVEMTFICSKCQIDGEDFVIFCGLLRKYELYYETDFFFCLDYLVSTTLVTAAVVVRSNAHS